MVCRALALHRAYLELITNIQYGPLSTEPRVTLSVDGCDQKQSKKIHTQNGSYFNFPQNIGSICRWIQPDSLMWNLSSRTTELNFTH